MPTRASSFLGGDSNLWRRALPVYSTIDLGAPFPGIRAEIRAVRNTVEKVFVVAPGGNPRQIDVRVDGAVGIVVTAEGELRVETGQGAVTFARPEAYQLVGAERRQVLIAYCVRGNRYGYEVGPYDPTTALVIDPLLSSTYFGGSGDDGWDYAGGISVAVDSQGNVFVASMTTSIDLPVSAGAYDREFGGGRDIFIAKLDPTLSTLLACTFFGGSGNERMPRLAIDSGDRVYLALTTTSNDVPTTFGAWDRSLSGASDVAIAVLDNDLSSLVASSYLGGSGGEVAESLQLGPAGDVVVAGTTDAIDFPTTSGAFQRWNRGGLDFFVARLDPTLSTLGAATLLGGRNQEQWPSLALDDAGNVFVSGGTGSPDYPVTSAAYDRSFNGSSEPSSLNMDACVSRLDSDLRVLEASTFVGTAVFDSAFICAVDDGGVVIGGHTEGIDFPTSPLAFDRDHNGINEYFLTKLDPFLAGIAASTFLTPNDAGFGFCDAIVSDGDAGLVVVGNAGEAFPTTADAWDTSYNGDEDGFVARLDPELHSMSPATYFGGSGREGVLAVALNTDGSILIAGYSTSLDLPTTRGALQPAAAGGVIDVYVGVFSSNLSAGNASFPRLRRRTLRPTR